ncbi:MAG: BamA/TamA family outer membrane protein [Planctomycetota bacterium]
MRILLALLLLLAGLGCRTSSDGEAPRDEQSIRLYGADFDVDVLDDEPTQVDVGGTDEDLQKRVELFIAPIPFRDPQIGWGGVLAGGAFFRFDPEDEETPPSVLAAAAFYTENSSRGVFGAFKGFLFRDTWRVLAAGGAARINYDFFGVGSGAGDSGISLPFQTDFGGGTLRALGRIAPNMYLGPAFLYGQAKTRVRTSLPLPPWIPRPKQFDTVNSSIGLHFERDTRDNVIYPTRGVHLELAADFFEEAWGSDFSFQAYDADFKSYHPLGEPAVLAWRLVGNLRDGDIPFFSLPNHDLRGYQQGRYRDRLWLAGEVEYRRHLWKRISGVVFAGIGEVAPTIDKMNLDDLLFSAGVGVRFRLTKDNPLNYAIDVAVGKNDVYFYFSLGEAF